MSTHWTLRCLLAPALAAMLLLLGSCTSSEDTPPAVLTLSELSGAWAGTCQPESGASGLESRLTAVLLDSAGAMTMHEYHWNNDTCQEQPAWFQQNVGTMSLPGGTVTTTFGTAAQADLAEVSSTITLFDPATITTFNDYGAGAGAFGHSPWEQGVPVDVTGLDQDGNPASGASKTLLMRVGETLFVGDEGTAPPGGYPTAVQPEVSRLPTAVVNAAGMTGAWSGTCRPEQQADFNVLDGAALEWIDIGAGSITVTTTFYSTPYCDRTLFGSQSDAVREVVETMTMSYTMASSANLLTERGLATGGDLVLTAHTLTPYTDLAAGALNAANDPYGAYGITGDGIETGWISGQTEILAPELQWDGTTAPGPLSMKIAAVLHGERFYVRGGEGPLELPYTTAGHAAGAGYPLTVGAEPLLRIATVTEPAHLAGSWYEPCRDMGDMMFVTGAVVISGSTATRKEWLYTDDFISSCRGTAELYTDQSYIATVQGTQPTDRGPATQVQLAPLNEGAPLCTLLVRAGDRLYGTDPQTALNATDCTGADFAALAGVHDGYSSLETTPVTTTPLSTYLGPCQANGYESRQYLGFHASAVSIVELHFEYTEGEPCTGPYLGDMRSSGVITYGAATTVDEGAATRITLLDSSGGTMKQIVKWMGDMLWSGYEDGPRADGYPTQLDPGDASVRSW